MLSPVPERVIFAKVNEFLGAKEVFLNSRQETIKELQNCCDKLESSNITGKYAKISEVGQYLSAGGNVASSLTLGIVKAIGETIAAGNNSAKRRSFIEHSEKFQSFLVNDVENLS